jgi:polyhydroxybutyrate depolymerase
LFAAAVAAVVGSGLAACGGEGDGSPPPVDAGAIEDGATRDSGVTTDGGDLAPDASVTDGGREPTDAASMETDGGAERCTFVGLAPGDVDVTLDHGGQRRAYRIHVPPSYDGTEALPLVLNFHGYTQTPEQQMAATRMNAEADDEGFIAVHPEGQGRSWNAGACCGDAAEEGLDDVGFVRAILDDVASRVCVDRRRVYATGMSNGGFLSHRLACEASDVIAAVAPVAGVLGIPAAECTPSRAIPVLHFHGTWDLLVPQEGRADLGFPSVEDTMTGWATRNGCTGEPAETYAMGDSRCETWSACTDGVEVGVCIIERGGHSWPGGVGDGSDINATDAMWSFLSGFALPH